MLNKSNIFGIKKLFDKTNTNMILLKNQIIKIKQSNEKEHLFNKKLLSRYFANYMIL